MHWRGRDKMGFLDYKRQPRILELLKDKINIAPNGSVVQKSLQDLVVFVSLHAVFDHHAGFKNLRKHLG
jgi:hypothetical protein